MIRRQRDLRRLLVGIANQYGARLVDIRNTNGGHLRATFAKNKTNIKMILACSPGDYRACRNLEAYAHRILRQPNNERGYHHGFS